MQEFLSSLATAATNPLAFVAYLVVVLAAIVRHVVASQNTQLKTLLDNIRSLPEADRKAIVQTQLNTIIPETITAHDFINQQRERYAFFKYIITVVATVIALLALAAILVYAWTNRLSNGDVTEIPTADVIIAKFENSGVDQSVEIARRLEENLQSQLQQYNLSNVQIEVISQTITNDTEARLIARQAESKAIIWGWYDNAGISVHILLAGNNRQTPGIAGISDIPLESESEPLALTVRGQLLPNVTFMSLFVIGHLKYLANDSIAGRAAFDAAMLNIPQNVQLDNKAIFHFFKARLLEPTNNEDMDIDAIICEYSEAIKLDPHLVEAYNNLGVILSRRTAPELSEKSRTCLTESGLEESEDPTLLFNKALEENPNWAVPKYNLLALRWDQASRSHEINAEVGPELKQVVQIDPNIIGAHIILGYIGFEEHDPQNAAQHFSEAVNLDKNSVKLHQHKAQALALAGEYAEAEQAFDDALKIDATNLEVHLAIANLALQRRKYDTARIHLDALPTLNTTDSENAPPSLAVVLRSRTLYDAGQLPQAIKTLEDYRSFVLTIPENEYGNKPQPHLFIDYLLYLLYSSIGDSGNASKYQFTLTDEDIKEVNSTLMGDFVASGSTIGELYARNQSFDVTWIEIVSRCTKSGNININEWGSTKNTCLPEDINERIDEVYNIFHNSIWYRLNYTSISMIILACPYVFTYDHEQQIWRRDTTILYRLVGRASETLQPRQLMRFDGRLLIREVEPEISYIDQIYVLVVDNNGYKIKLEPQLTILHDADLDYLHLKQGDEILLQFPAYREIPNLEQIWVVAKGYYIPLPHVVGRQ